jgi:hypothetical protein
MSRRIRRNYSPAFKAKVVLAAVKGAAASPVDVETLHAEIGELTLEYVFFRRRARQGGIAERKAMIDRTRNAFPGPLHWGKSSPRVSY